jgi:NAD(P)-dependent dehydrogenase (short-subunit alcohol dehydrogenase family)
MSMRRLESKIILVAGAGGIGGELARRYAGEGAAVVVGDIDLDGAHEVVADITRAGGTATATQLDGADPDSIAAAVALTTQHYGGLDGLHANFASFADTAIDVGVLDLPLAIYDETMRVNARGFFLCTRFALPAILARGGGAILYTSSAAAYIGEQTRVAYAMSKAAGHALMRHVAAKYGPSGVRANCIAPGLIMHDRWDAKMIEAVKGWVDTHGFIRRAGRPTDIASVSSLLMSDEGSFITGQIINVDGGSTLRA